MNAQLQTQKLILEHIHRYPELQIRDIFKFLHQSSFGCEHLLHDPSAAVDYIQKEALTAHPHEGDPVEVLDGKYVRVYLDLLKGGLSAQTFGKLFFSSARTEEDGRERLEEKLTVLLEMAQAGALAGVCAAEDVKSAIDDWRAAGFPAIHHSEKFRENYHPAYRVIRKEFVPFLPLLAKIDAMMAERSLTQEKSLVIAIEGGSASGKSTLGAALEQIYDCTLLHMDDFFLRPEQRTPERFAEPGGNVDRERFLEEVLEPIRKGDKIAYRRFDCSTFTVLPAQMIDPKPLIVIEGAYSMHPELSGYYDFSAFLDVDPKVQKKRIGKRNSPEMAKRFFEEWIPLEHVYFEKRQVKERCGMIIAIEQ